MNVFVDESWAFGKNSLKEVKIDDIVRSCAEVSHIPPGSSQSSSWCQVKREFSSWQTDASGVSLYLNGIFRYTAKSSLEIIWF